MSDSGCLLFIIVALVLSQSEIHHERRTRFVRLGTLLYSALPNNLGNEGRAKAKQSNCTMRTPTTTLFRLLVRWLLAIGWTSSLLLLRRAGATAAFLSSSSRRTPLASRVVVLPSEQRPRLLERRFAGRLLLLQASGGAEDSSSPVNDDGDHHNSKDKKNETIVTKEMFLRELLKDPSPEPSPVVKRSSKNGSNGKKRQKNQSGHPEYKVLDNRDSLPFSVRRATPDPYTHPELKRKNAAQMRKKKKRPPRPDAVEHSIASSLYSGGKTNSEGGDNLETLLGEFDLDRYTTTGDILEIGDVSYRVVRHRCLYKYAGGKKFVMTRKILHVKEVGRIQAEEYLARQWKASGGGGGAAADALE